MGESTADPQFVCAITLAREIGNAEVSGYRRERTVGAFADVHHD